MIAKHKHDARHHTLHRGKIHRAPSKYPPGEVTVLPDEGMLTFISEGQEGGYWHSRVLSVPSSSSGLTIGRGYDMGKKSEGQIFGDLTKAGVDKDMAEKISKGAGLTGQKAKDFIVTQSLGDFEITQTQQRDLFKSTYASKAGVAHDMCEKKDVVALYGPTDWAKLNSVIKDIVVDLTYRGDYTGTTRAIIQPSIVDNDLDEVYDALNNRDNWKNVPLDRFNARVKYVKDAIDARDKFAKGRSSR